MKFATKHFKCILWVDSLLQRNFVQWTLEFNKSLNCFLQIMYTFLFNNDRQFARHNIEKKYAKG